MIRKFIAAVHNDEEGHAAPFIGALAAAAGVIVLAIGAASDSDVTIIIGGIVGGVGLLAYNVLHHVTVDWEMYRRTTK